MRDSFRFIVMGDSSKDSTVININVLRTLLSRIKELSPQPEAIFFLGDMVDGGSKVGEQLDMWKDLVASYYPITMYYTAIGNHEGNESAFSSAFSYLPYEQLKGYQRTTYYFDHENARFIIINSNRTSQRQRIWLENVLSTSNKKYNFVMFHIPAFPTGHHYGESLDANPKERDALWEIIDRHDVTAVFAGHEHNYSRRLIDKAFGNDRGLSIQNSIYHIITGGAGTSLNARNTDIKNVVIGPLGLYHYTLIDVNDERVTLQAYDLDNILIDSCSIIPREGGELSNSIEDIIVPICALWKYLDDGSEQKTNWRELSFDDSLWKSGFAELGYGDGHEATVVGYGPDVHNKYITTYFRKRFTVQDTSLYKGLTIRIQKDDGAVVYLNGEEIYRTNMPAGDIKADTLACRAIDDPEESLYEKVEIDAGLLKNGDNVIAVEIHQASSGSSDISFNFELLGSRGI